MPETLCEAVKANLHQWYWDTLFDAGKHNADVLWIAFVYHHWEG